MRQNRSHNIGDKIDHINKTGDRKKEMNDSS